jgi:AraC-like DNA-binding protein
MKRHFNPIVLNVIPEVKKVLDKNYAVDSVDTLATTFHISRNALQDAFKQECGLGIREYKLKQRMAVALQMLEGGKGIKEIAFTLRYATISAFSRAFKKYYGVTPTEWNKIGQNVY